MFCPSCGKSANAGVRFCPNCGTQIGSASFTGAGFPPPSTAPLGKLVRPRFPRMIAGVCAAFAQQYGWDLSLVRIVTVAFAILTSGFGGLCYLGAWVIIPDAPFALPPEVVYTPTTPPSSSAGTPTV